MIDETQEWKDKQELKESHERFRKSFYNNPIAQIILDSRNRNIKDANEQFLALSGLTYDEIIGENISSAGITPCTEDMGKYKLSSLTEHGLNACEAIMRVKYGDEINVLQSYVSIKLNGAPHELWTIIDLSALKQAENHLKHLNKTLEHKVYERTQDLTRLLEREKLINDLKARFIAMASHEFRTPLTTILMSADLLETYLKNNDVAKCAKHIRGIKAAVKLLTEILEDFLSLNSIEQGLVKPLITGFNITDIAGKITDEIGATLKQGQHIAYAHTGPELVRQDINILKNVMLNLLANASKYAAEGTTITLTTSVKKDNILITVADSGIGIPEDDQPHIFTRFFRARNAEVLQGTGLGLHIAKKYVRLLHGKINFVSKENVGTTFMVEVPLLK